MFLSLRHYSCYVHVTMKTYHLPGRVGAMSIALCDRQWRRCISVRIWLSTKRKWVYPSSTIRIRIYRRECQRCYCYNTLKATNIGSVWWLETSTCPGVKVLYSRMVKVVRPAMKEDIANNIIKSLFIQNIGTF